MKIYQYEKNKNNDFELHPAENNPSYKNSYPKSTYEFDITFSSPYITGIKKNDTVTCRLFVNKKLFVNTADFNQAETTEDNGDKIIAFRKNPEAVKNYFNRLKHKSRLLIFIHGFSTSEKKIINYYRFAEKITDNNTLCLFVNLPFHLSRTPENESSGKRLVYYDDKETLSFFHQCVVDIRKSIDIAEELVAPAETDICGISLGAMVSVVAKALEARIRKAVLLLGGGYWEDIHWKGILRFVLKGNCADSGTINRNKCHEYYANYFDFLDSLKKEKNMTFLADSDINNPDGGLCTKKCYLCDPLTFAHMINHEDVIMLNSNFDHFFTRKSTILLWKELGKPKIYWLNYPHFSSILSKPKTYGIISDFLFQDNDLPCMTGRSS